MSDPTSASPSEKPDPREPGLSAALAPVSEARLLLAADQTISDCDALAARLLRRPVGQILGRPLTELFAGEGLADPPSDRGARRLALVLAGLPDSVAAIAIELTLSPLPAAASAASWQATFHEVSVSRPEPARQAIESITRAMARAGSPERALSSLLSALGGSMGWATGTYWAVASDGSFERRASWSAAGADPEPPANGGESGPQPRSDSLAILTRDRGELTWIEDLAAHPELGADGPGAGARGAAGTPVVRDGAVIGVIVFLAAEPRRPDQASLEALLVAGAQVGELLAILEERHSLLASLAELALTDELTGLPNRRAWEEALARELARAARARHPVCVAVLDLDVFKDYNDEYGHPAGDRVLAAAAHAWQRELRTYDLIARYGGEEFAALIPAWPLQIGTDVVERLRRATPGPLTASAGVAIWNGSESGRELFARADAALYAAKQAGRDQTIAHRASEVDPDAFDVAVE